MEHSRNNHRTDKHELQNMPGGRRFIITRMYFSIAFIIVLLLLFTGVGIAKEQEYRSGDYSYTIDADGNATITKE